jgi:hypothetical protein
VEEGDAMMIKKFRSGLLTIGALVLAPFAANALPVVYSLSSGGLDGAHICSGTTAATCPTTIEFTYAPPAAPPNAYDPASGTITLDSTAGTVAFSMSVASATFLAVGGVPDNGVDEIEFTSLLYSGTLTGATFTPGTFGSTVISWAPQTLTASVSGNYEQLLLGGNVNGVDPFVASARMSAGTCTLTASNFLTCGFILGPGGPFALNVGPDATPASRRVVHSLNVVAVPEPGTVLLMALGIAGIAMRGRTR